MRARDERESKQVFWSAFPLCANNKKKYIYLGYNTKGVSASAMSGWVGVWAVATQSAHEFQGNGIIQIVDIYYTFIAI